MVKITSEILEKMKEMRRQGATYREIEDVLNVSRWACITYLKDVKPEEPAIIKEWKKAEEDAFSYLKEKGFTDLHNLNTISPSPYWDILARKNEEWWLIDVTISEGKKLGAKIPRLIDGYIHAILYRNIENNTWKLVKLTYEEII